nr:retrovirus-related Pol polyprotein from transposon TNT 1-94 [Tanacetum cinerariifolium]
MNMGQDRQMQMVGDNTKTRRPQPRSNTKNDRVPSTSKSSRSKNKGVEVEEHHMNLLLSKNKKHMSSECNNVKLATENVYSKVVYAICKQCLISVNHDECLLTYVNDMNSCGKKQTTNVSIKEKQQKRKPKGNILITRVYFVEELGHNLFSVGQFCYSDLEVAFRRNACFVRNLEGVDLLKGKSKRASHPPKLVLNSRQRLHLLHMDLCGPLRIASINGKRVFNRRTKKIMETMNVSFVELSAMAFEQRSSKPGLQSMTSGQITMYDDYIGGQPSATARTVPAAQEPQLKKALYGLKQPPRAWYDELLMFLLQNHFFKGTIDLTLFIRRFYDDILVDFGFELTGFSDADYAGCKDTFKSTSGRA